MPKRKLTNVHKLDLPAPFIREAVRQLNAYSGDTDRSATSLNNPTRMMALLDRFGGGNMDITEYTKLMVGSVMHEAMARQCGVTQDHDSNSWEWGGPAHEMDINEAQAEVRLRDTLLSMPLSGQFDYYDMKRGILWDYKFGSAWGDVFEPEHLGNQQQGWNLRTFLAAEGWPDPKEVRNLLVFTDWSKAKSGTGKYPELPIKVFVHPRTSLVECQAYTKDRVRLHQQDIQAQDRGDLLTDCTDSERWARFRKGKAPVYGRCKDWCNAYNNCDQAGGKF
jgi:hypothetical protein